METTTHRATDARAGDWIEVNGLPGWSPRKGQILEVLGHGSHEHYRVRWDEEHESIFFPTEGAVVIRPPDASRRRRTSTPDVAGRRSLPTAAA